MRCVYVVKKRVLKFFVVLKSNFNVLQFMNHLCLQEDVEECESAAEFLLEPWVLVQLPFQPVLLHQWSVPLMAKSLKLKEQLGYIGKKFLLMANLMFTTAKKYFGLFIDNVYKGAIFYSLEAFPETLAVLEFALSKECRNAVKAFKRMAWNRSNKTDFDPILLTPQEGFLSCYYPQYWTVKWHVVLMSADAVAERLLKPINLDGYKEQIGLDVTEAEVQGLKNLVEEKLIKSGMLKGVSKQVLFNYLLGEGRRCAIEMYRTCTKEQSSKLARCFLFGKITVFCISEMIQEGIRAQDCSAMYNLFLPVVGTQFD